MGEMVELINKNEVDLIQINSSVGIGHSGPGEEMGVMPMLNEEESFMGVADFE